ncbi:hypothetical protein [Streptomyces chartreusis]|uniref:hypothetical protein n=1 Tax=Streptomyces chartreusis TaxID=1969 RepID=UPI0037881881
MESLLPGRSARPQALRGRRPDVFAAVFVAGFFARQLARGKTPKEAMRLLRRRVSDRVFRSLLADENAAQPSDLGIRLAA